MRRQIRLRGIAALAVLLLMAGAIVGAVLVNNHNGSSQAALRAHGVPVTGTVVGHYSESTRDGTYYYNEVKWTYLGHSYEDPDTDGPYDSPSELSSPGSQVQVLVDPQDPFTYSIDGSYPDESDEIGAMILLIAAATGFCLLGLFLVRLWWAVWSVTRRGPLIEVTVASIHHELRREGRRAHTVTTEVLRGDDPRLPVVIGNYGAAEGRTLWLALGRQRALVCSPGGFRIHTYRLVGGGG